MEGLFKEVVIKEVSENAAPDKVFVIENLPKKFLVQEVAEMKNVKVGKAEVEEVATGKMLEVPLPGIERDRRKDNVFVFFVTYNEAKDRLADIDRYIESVFPKDQRIPKRVYNSTDLSSTRAYPLAVEDMPKVKLPLLEVPTQVSPRASDELVAPAQTSASIDVEAIKAAAIAEHEAKKKEEQRERMAAARAAKK